MANVYLPLSILFPKESLPEPLQALSGGISAVFDMIGYRDLIYTSDFTGTKHAYSVILISPSLAIDIAGTGLVVWLNTPPDNPSESEFPVRVEFQWEILKYLKDFDVNSFSRAGDAFMNIARDILPASDIHLLAAATFTFANDNLQQFITDINTALGLSFSYDSTLTDAANAENLVSYLVDTIQLSMWDVIIGTYFLSGLPTELKEKAEHFLNALAFGNTTLMPGQKSIIERIEELLTPRINALLVVNAGIDFPRNILKPVDVNGEVETDESIKTRITFGEVDFFFDTHGKSGIKSDINVSFASAHPTAEIGNTGLGIGFQHAKLDLSKTSNIEEADADGRPVDFVGVYVQKVDITLPKKWFKEENGQTLKISGQNVLIGTGGLSGTIALQTSNNAPLADNYFWFALGKDASKAWRIGFNSFDITFKQNAIISSNLTAALEIAKLKDSSGNTPLRIDMKGHLHEDGDFSLTASVVGGVKAQLFNFVTLNFLTLELGREEDNFFIGTSCEVTFQNAIMKQIFKDQKIVLPRLRVYSNGHLEIVGGNTFIPTNISIKLGPVDVAVTGIHFGSHEQSHGGVMRKYNYWGFDGAISLDPLGIDARGEGIQFYHTVDNDDYGGDGHCYLRIQTIEIDMVIPGTASPASAVAIIHGMLSIPEPGESPEYIGEISVKLPKAKIAGGAAMRLQPKHPAFVVDAFIDPPSPIPIGPIGIYGFRGLFCFRYVAEKEAVGLVSGVDSWYDYYTHPPKGIHVTKFSGPAQTKDYSFPFSIGAGAVLGTSFDSGTVLSIRAMLLLSIPTLFMIEGRATILSSRLGLTDTKEPPFFAFIAWGDNSIELGLGADLQLPQSNGWIVDIQAQVQAGFFFKNPSAWYINFGDKQDPITARVLTLVTARSYLMFSAKGIETGARVDFDLNQRFGPATVHIYAYLEVGGHISFEQPQIGGYLALGGMIDIDIWIVGITIGLDAILSVEAAKPFLLFAELKVYVCIKVVFKKICKSFTVQLKWEKDSSVNYTPIPALSMFTSSYRINRTNELVRAVHMLTNETFSLDYFGAQPDYSQINKIIPLDTFIDLKVTKGLVPNAVDAKIGGHTGPAENFIDLVPPEKTVCGGHVLRQVKHTYSIETIEIKAWNGSQWIEYHPYQAITNDPQVANLRIGYWQRSGDQYDTIRILGTNPFAYTESGEPGWFIPEQYGLTPSSLFCVSQQKNLDCSNVLNKELGTTYYPPQQYPAHYINGAYYTLKGGVSYDRSSTGLAGLNGNFMRITDEANSFGFEKSLSFNNYNSLVITLPQPSVSVNLRLSTHAHGVTIKYFKSVINDDSSRPEYTLIETIYKTSGELESEVLYDNITDLVMQVVIEPTTPETVAINQVLEQIDELYEQTYKSESGEVSITNPSNRELYHNLVKKLETLQLAGCTTGDKYAFANYYELDRANYPNGKRSAQPTAQAIDSLSVNESSTTSATPSFDITNSAKGNVSLSNLYCNDIIKFGSNYLLCGFVSSIDNNFGDHNSLLLEINSRGDILRERKIQGDIKDIKVIAEQVYLLTVRKETGIHTNWELPQLIKLDTELNQTGELEFSSAITNTNYLLCPVQDKYVFLISAIWVDRVSYDIGNANVNTTQIVLVDTEAMTIHGAKNVSGVVAHKAVARDDMSYLVLANGIYNGMISELFTVELTGNLEISVKDAFYPDRATISDLAVTRGGNILVTGINAGGTPFVGTVDQNSIIAYVNPRLGSLSFSKNIADDSDVLMYDIRRTIVLDMTSVPVVTNAKRLIKPVVLNGPDINMYTMVNDPDSNQCFMLAGERGYYSGIVVATFDESLDTCLLAEDRLFDGFDRTIIRKINTGVEIKDVDIKTKYPGIVISPSHYITITQKICPLVTLPNGTTRCTTALQQICWMTVNNYEYNQTIPGQEALVQDQQDMVAAIQKIAQPVWRPNTTYCIHFTLKDNVDDGNGVGLFEYYYGFRTVGPVGHYHKNSAVDYVPVGENADRYPLTSLRQYIDYNRSFPNADGSLLQAKPLYYGHEQCKITVFFTQPLLYHMLNTWRTYNGLPELQGEMHIAIKDPVTDVVVPYPLPVGYHDETVPVPSEADHWQPDNDPRMPLNIRLLNNMVNYVNSHSNVIQCQLAISQPLVPAAQAFSVTLTNLKPRKLYTAILYNAFETESNNVMKSEEVHQYAFQTSRYASFKEQVRSYTLKDDQGNTKQAVFNISLTLSAAAITTAYNIVVGNPDVQSEAIQLQYQHLFDRATEGVLGLRPVDPPVTTEFNVLRNETTGDVIGVLIRSPEPYNIPKIPLDIIMDTLLVLQEDGTPNSAYKTLHSKDYSQILIMHDSKKITAASLVFKFTYMTWNGTVYTVEDAVITDSINIDF